MGYVDYVLKVFQFFSNYLNYTHERSIPNYDVHMPRQRLDPDTITRMAMAVVDDHGLDALSLSAVAQRLGVGPSALYSHVDGLEGLRQLVAMGAVRAMVTRVQQAAIGVAGPGAVASMGHAYRRFALEHPGQFRSTMAHPGQADDRMAAALNELLDVFALVFSGAGLGRAESAAAARQARSAIHGFVSLEASAGSTPEHDSQYLELIEMVCRMIDPT